MVDLSPRNVQYYVYSIMTIQGLLVTMSVFGGCKFLLNKLQNDLSYLEMIPLFIDLSFDDAMKFPGYHFWQ